jgi:hypothetical protein
MVTAARDRSRPRILTRAMPIPQSQRRKSSGVSPLHFAVFLLAVTMAKPHNRWGFWPNVSMWLPAL